MCALAPWYGETLYSSGVMMGQVVRRMLLQWRRWARAGQISFLPGWIQKKVWHINCLELRVFHLVLEYFLPKCITALFLENGQHRYTYDACKSQRDAPFYVPINIFSLSELCMFPSAGLVWQPSPELWNLHVWSVSRACQYHKTHHTEYCAQEWTPFFRCLYAHKWREFMNWCAAQNDDRVNCPMSAIL